MNILDEDFMKMAIEEAHVSLDKGFLPVGVVVVQDGAVIARGGKQGHTHYSLDHAERNVLEAILTDRSAKMQDATVYTTLEPCLMCLGLMLNVRVSRIVYALEDPYGGGVCMLRPDALPIRHQKEHPFISAGILREETRILFKEFFASTASSFWKNPDNPLVKLCREK